MGVEEIIWFLQSTFCSNKLNKLDDKCQSLIKYQVINEKKYKEIAEHFNMKIGTVMSSLSRCWDKLKELKYE